MSYFYEHYFQIKLLHIQVDEDKFVFLYMLCAIELLTRSSAVEILHSQTLSETSLLDFSSVCITDVWHKVSLSR
jgi:hypothetical protein